MTNGISLTEQDLTALAAFCEGALEGANPPIPAAAILNLAALAIGGAR